MSANSESKSTTAVSAEPINGVEVSRLFETIDAIKSTPTLAEFTFRLDNEWIDGGRNQSTINTFYGAGQEHTDRTEPFVLGADEPPVLLGRDSAPNPVEYLLHALAACVTTSMVYHAAAKGIRIEEVRSRVEGDVDLHGFLGLDANVPRGYKNIRIVFQIKADVPMDQLEEVVMLGPGFSPVFDTITRAVNVEVALER
ncbi:MAG: OsmC family protein [Blastocatellia bacterium]|nr:OsmC family protein [Blastocatellia bacterium]